MQNTYQTLATSLTPVVLAAAIDPVSMSGFYAANAASDIVMAEWRRRGAYGSQKAEADQAVLSILEALVAHYERMTEGVSA